MHLAGSGGPGRGFGLPGPGRRAGEQEEVSARPAGSKEVHPAQGLPVFQARWAVSHVVVDPPPLVPGQRAGLKSEDQGAQLEAGHQLGRLLGQRRITRLGQAQFRLPEKHVHGAGFLAQDLRGLPGRAAVFQAEQQHIVLVSGQGRSHQPEAIHGLAPFRRQVGQVSGREHADQDPLGKAVLFQVSLFRPLLALRPAPHVGQGVPGDASYPALEVHIAVVAAQRVIGVDKGHLGRVLRVLGIAGPLPQVVLDGLGVEPEQLVEGRFISLAETGDQLPVAVGGRERRVAGIVGRGFDCHVANSLSHCQMRRHFTTVREKGQSIPGICRGSVGIAAIVGESTEHNGNSPVTYCTYWPKLL